jgi:acetyl esterase/lipase
MNQIERYMRLNRNFGLLLLLVVPIMGVCQQGNQPAYPPTIPGAQVETYKTMGDVDLRLWIFTPEGHSANEVRPAIVFFFGGGWRGGNPIQFTRHCEYLAARGMVAIAADYRVSSRHGVTANQCVEDAKSVLRWLRKHSDRMGIDPDRIVASGGSAGGHLAAATATLPDFNDPGDDLTISARPNALVLFNPVLVLGSIPEAHEPSMERIQALKERLGVDPESISPYHNMKSGMPPAMIFHGTADQTVPYRSIELFCEKMEAQGDQCVLIGYDGADHGFFNYGRNDNVYYIDTMNEVDNFLVSLGYIRGVAGKVIGE